MKDEIYKVVVEKKEKDIIIKNMTNENLSLTNKIMGQNSNSRIASVYLEDIKFMEKQLKASQAGIEQLE